LNINPFHNDIDLSVSIVFVIPSLTIYLGFSLKIALQRREGNAAHEMDRLDKRRVAVLPLKNMSPDPNDGYFAEGMTEELITVLSGIRELTVIARTSVMQYRASPKRVVDVGRELGTGTILEGSVRKAGNGSG
jgi:TolB-like protein